MDIKEVSQELNSQLDESLDDEEEVDEMFEGLSAMEDD